MTHKYYESYKPLNSYKSHSWSGEFVGLAVTDQNRVVDDHTSFAGQKLSIARPCEAEDSIRGEISQLARRAAINRLGPDVRDALPCGDISQRATIRRPAEK